MSASRVSSTSYLKDLVNGDLRTSDEEDGSDLRHLSEPHRQLASHFYKIQDKYLGKNFITKIVGQYAIKIVSRIFLSDVNPTLPSRKQHFKVGIADFENP